MKRIGKLYEQICSFENLYEAYLMARASKRYRGDVLEFTATLEENLIILQNELIYRTYKVGRYKEFYIVDPKKRLIMALPFRDRVVQWAVYRVIMPMIDKQFIDDSYGCRIGKGVSKALERLQYWLRQTERRQDRYYYLKLDISKYFYRIDHGVLMRILASKIKDNNLLWLLRTIIDSEDVAFGLPLGVSPGNCPDSDRLFDKGMPIGNLLSQLFANLYLDQLDQYVKHELHVHFYMRYMDDMLILSSDKKELRRLEGCIETFLTEKLKLNLNSKTRIAPTKQGIEFCGMIVYSTHKKIRKSSARRIRKAFKRLKKRYAEGEPYENLRPSIQSYFGLMQHFNSYKFKDAILSKFALKRGGDG